jgi:pilus assembly protein CpaF
VIDAEVVDEVRANVASVLGALKGEMPGEDVAFEIVKEEVDAYAARLLDAPVPRFLTLEERDEIVEAVMADLFGLGRIQRLLDDPSVENINANGCDRVWVTRADGSKRLEDPIADSDAELIEMIRVIVARRGTTERRFTGDHPEVDLRLPDGSRLSAVMEVTERPSLSIRCHRLKSATLAELVGRGMLDQGMAAFLHAAVRARKNIMVAGAMGAGKTTMLRALASAAPPWERIITIEDSFELGFDKAIDPETGELAHPDCVAMEAREANLEGTGEITVTQLVKRSLRMSSDRVIVGEVRGSEVIPMLNAMSQGQSGSMCTIHSDSSEGVFRRIASFAAQSAERLSLEAANLLIAGSVHLVVYISMLDEGEAVSDAGSWSGHRYRRVVSSIREVVGAEGSLVVSNELWCPGPDGQAVLGDPPTPRLLRDLAAQGYRHQNLARAV